MFFLLFVLLWFPGVVGASQDVHPQTPLYGSAVTVSDALYILESCDLFQSYLGGDAIRSEAYVTKLLHEAKGRREKCDQQLPLTLLDLLQKQYPESEKRWNTVSAKTPELHFQYFGFEDDSRTLQQSGGLAGITSPWTAYREGVSYADGHNTVSRASLAASVGSWFDLQMTPQLLTQHKQEKNDVAVHAGTFKFTAKNFEVRGGRFPLYWGQSHRSRVLFSGNASPRDGVSIGSPIPFYLPWIFKHLGPFTYRLVFHVHNNPIRRQDAMTLNGRVIFKPWENLEFGITRVVHFGGEGSPSLDFYEPLAELFGIRKDGWIFNIPFREQAHQVSGTANNALGIDLRWRMPRLRSTEFFFELYNEDPLDVLDFFPEDSVLHMGLWIPRFSRHGRWQVLIDATYLAQIVYSHHFINSGLTNNNRILGNDIGPQGLEFHLWNGFLVSPKTKIWTSFTATRYRTHKISLPSTPSQPADEDRFRIQVGFDHAVTKRAILQLATGAQQIDNFGYERGISKRSLMGEVNLRWQF